MLVSFYSLFSLTHVRETTSLLHPSISVHFTKIGDQGRNSKALGSQTSPSEKFVVVWAIKKLGDLEKVSMSHFSHL